MRCKYCGETLESVFLAAMFRDVGRFLPLNPPRCWKNPYRFHKFEMVEMRETLPRETTATLTGRRD